MASPATTAAVRPLDATAAAVSGPAPVTAVVAAHLRRLGARQDGPGTPDPAGGTVLSGEGFAPVRATARWGAPGSGLVDEATVQAATGIMAVHGRRDGAPAGLAADCAATATGVLVVQGLLAALIGQARGRGRPGWTPGRTSPDSSRLPVPGRCRRRRGRGRRTRARWAAVHLRRRRPLRTGDARPGRVGGLLARPGRTRRRDTGRMAPLPVPLRHRLRALPARPPRDHPAPDVRGGPPRRRPLRRPGVRPADPGRAVRGGR